MIWEDLFFTVHISAPSSLLICEYDHFLLRKRREGEWGLYLNEMGGRFSRLQLQSNFLINFVPSSSPPPPLPLYFYCPHHPTEHRVKKKGEGGGSHRLSFYYTCSAAARSRALSPQKIADSSWPHCYY